MDIDALLQEEREKNEGLRSQNEILRKALIALQTTSEMEEEKITNNLLRKIQALQKEKEELLQKVEEEEEIIANQIQKKLKQLQKEKVELENVLEQEQESMVNRLQKQLDELLRNSPTSGCGPIGWMRTASSERKLSQIGLDKRHSSSSSSSSINESFAPSSNVVEMLRAENNSLKSKLNDQKVSIDHWILSCQDQYGAVVKTLLKLNPSSTAPLTLPTPPILSTSPSGVIEINSDLSSVGHHRRKSSNPSPVGNLNSSNPSPARKLLARIPLG